MWNEGSVGYHQFIHPETGETHGSFEVFEHRPSIPFPGDDEPFEHGFYWRACFPGCLPDGPAFGPFKTASEAYSNAQGNPDRQR